MKILDEIILALRVLSVFNMARETMKGEITLLVNAARLIKETKLYVIDRDMRYNVHSKRLWIHGKKIFPSKYIYLKFSTPKENS